jgi:germacradienol/geosmin synthase
MFEDFQLDQDVRTVLLDYAADLRNWLAGILTWHEGCRRYDESELRYHPVVGTRPFGGPTGLGTAIVHLGA